MDLKQGLSSKIKEEKPKGFRETLYFFTQDFQHFAVFLAVFFIALGIIAFAIWNIASRPILSIAFPVGIACLFIIFLITEIFSFKEDPLKIKLMLGIVLILVIAGYLWFLSVGN